MKIFFKSEKNKDISQHGKAKRIHHRKIHTKSSKDSSSRVRKMIPDRKTEMQERKSKHVDKSK